MIPPIASVRALEAAIRTGGFGHAALELGVSQSAISQSIRKLERQLGVDMFARSPGRVVATAEGLRYAEAVRPALKALFEAGRQVAPGIAPMVTLGCSRALLNNWLLPRLSRSFVDQDTVDVVGLDRDTKELRLLDLAILYAGLLPPPSGARLIMKEVSVAVAAPSLAAEIDGALERSRYLEKAKLLGNGWDEWCALAGVERPATKTVRVREASALLSAARAGDGLALLPSLICADDLEAGRLKMVSPVMINRQRGYWLYRSSHNPDRASRLNDWLEDLFTAVRVPDLESAAGK